MESRDNISVIESYFSAQNNFYSTLESNPEFFFFKNVLEYFEQEINKIPNPIKKKKKAINKRYKERKENKKLKSLISSLRKLSTAMFESGESMSFFQKRCS